MFDKVSKRGKLNKGHVATGRDEHAASGDVTRDGFAVEFCSEPGDGAPPHTVGADEQPLAAGAYLNAPTLAHAKTNQPADVRLVGTPTQWHANALVRGTTLPLAGKWSCGDPLMGVYVRVDELFGVHRSLENGIAVDDEGASASGNADLDADESGTGTEAEDVDCVEAEEEPECVEVDDDVAVEHVDEDDEDDQDDHDESEDDRDAENAHSMCSVRCVFVTFENRDSLCYASVAVQLLLAAADAIGADVPQNFVDRLPGRADEPQRAIPSFFPAKGLIRLPRNRKRTPQQDPSEMLVTGALWHKHAWWSEATSFGARVDTLRVCINEDCPSSGAVEVDQLMEAHQSVNLLPSNTECPAALYGTDIVDALQRAFGAGESELHCERCRPQSTMQLRRRRQPLTAGGVVDAPLLLYAEVMRGRVAVAKRTNRPARHAAQFAVFAAIRFGKYRYRLIAFAVNSPGHHWCFVERSVGVGEERRWLEYDDVGGQVNPLASADEAIKCAFLRRSYVVSTAFIYAREGELADVRDDAAAFGQL